MIDTRRVVTFLIWVATYLYAPVLLSAPPLAPTDLVLAAGPPDIGYFERADCTTLNAVAYATTCKSTGTGGGLLQGMMYVYNGKTWQGVYPSVTEDATTVTTSKDLVVGSGSTETLSKAELTAMKALSITILATSSDNGKTFWRNNKAAATVTEIWCQSDTSTAVVNVQRDDGSPANILSSDVTCDTDGATGTIDTGEDNLAVGNKLIFVWSSGSATSVTLQVTAPLD